MIKLVSRFFIFITFSLGILFAIHVFALNLLSIPLFENKIVTSYIVNLLLAFIIYVILIRLKEKYAESLGYIFFGGSFLKFMAFFILIYPSFKSDGDISKLEFSSFFIPYVCSLIIEVIFVIKLLNK